MNESVLITGTTSGLGRALLEHYSRRGASVVCVNRRRVPELESEFSSVRFECVDVRSSEQVDELVRRLAESRQPPQIFFLNAGINRVDNDESFDLASYRAVIETNLYGVLNFIQPITRLSLARPHSGQWTPHVIAISSMASYVGNPYGLGYHTSKRALSACFDVWARMYSGTGLVFQQVMLGPVPTAITTMSDGFPPWMVQVKNAFSASPDAAARAICQFALTGRKKLFYPRKAVPLYFGMCLGQALIPGFFQGRTTLAGNARRGGER